MASSRADLEAERQLRQLCAELRRCLLAGEDCRAETLLASHPLVASDPDLALEVVLAEFAVRKELGQRPTPAEWYERFPQWRDRLEREFQLERALLGGDSSAPPTEPEDSAATGPNSPRRGAPPARALGRYELRAKLGQGGMGVVYRAYDPRLKRDVALKMIRGGDLADAEQVERFLREARAAAQMRHPNIVRILDIGEQDGQHYFAMEFVAGGKLADHRQRFADPRAAAGLVEKLARAVQHAHEHRIIHRDLKPANVLLDERGEPQVSDFGLAKFVGAATDLTREGDVLGTLPYMAPEQAAGRAGQVTARSDVWSLGVILYELLTGRRPFTGQGPEEIVYRVLTAEPPEPRALRPSLDPVLEAVTLMCLRKDSAERYPSAADLADDLMHWQRGGPTRARPEGRLRRTWRRVRGHPTLRLGLALALLLPAVLGSLALARRSDSRVDGSAAPNKVSREPLKFIGEDGLVKPPRWPAEPGKVTLEAPGVIRLESEDLCLLELGDQVPWECYAFEAEVKDLGRGLTTVGIYALGRKQPHDKGADLWFFTLSFSEFAGFHPGNESKSSKPEARLELRRFGDGLGLRSLASSPFTPGGEEWPRIRIEVTPETVCGFWHDEATPLGRETKGTVAKHYREMASRRGGAAPVWSPQGSFGLFCDESKALFRQAVLRPLPEGR